MRSSALEASLLQITEETIEQQKISVLSLLNNHAHKRYMLHFLVGTALCASIAFCAKAYFFDTTKPSAPTPTPALDGIDMNTLSTEYGTTVSQDTELLINVQRTLSDAQKAINEQKIIARWIQAHLPNLEKHGITTENPAPSSSFLAKTGSAIGSWTSWLARQAGNTALGLFLARMLSSPFRLLDKTNKKIDELLDETTLAWLLSSYIKLDPLVKNASYHAQTLHAEKHNKTIQKNHKDLFVLAWNSIIHAITTITAFMDIRIEHYKDNPRCQKELNILRTNIVALANNYSTECVHILDASDNQQNTNETLHGIVLKFHTSLQHILDAFQDNEILAEYF